MRNFITIKDNSKFFESHLDLTFTFKKFNEDTFNIQCLVIDLNSSIDSDILTNICLTIKNSNKLKEIILGSIFHKNYLEKENKNSLLISKNHRKIFLKSIKDNTSIEYLSLINCNLHQNDAIELSYALENNINIKSIWIANNNIGDNGMKFISHKLIKSKLESLILENVGISDNCCKYIAKLVNNISLKVLIIQRNKIQNNGYAQILSNLKCSKLETLSIFSPYDNNEETSFLIGKIINKSSNLSFLRLNKFKTTLDGYTVILKQILLSNSLIKFRKCIYLISNISDNKNKLNEIKLLENKVKKKLANNQQ